MMTLIQLKYFLTACRCGSLTNAAEELKVAQPTLSEQMRKLEKTLGVSLFLRSTQGLILTEAGEKFRPHAQRVLDEVREAETSVSDIKELKGGTLSFGMFNSAQYVLRGLIPAFRAQYPGVSLRLIGSNSAEVADAVREGRLEAGVVALPIDDRGLKLSDVLWSCEAAYFHVDPTVLDHPLTIEDLVSRPLILPEAGWSNNDPSRRQLNERAQQQGLSLTPDIEVETTAAGLEAATSGCAGMVASMPVAEALGYTKRLHWASLDPPIIETFAIIVRDPIHLSPATQVMIDLVKQHMRMLHNERPAAPHLDRVDTGAA